MGRDEDRQHTYGVESRVLLILRVEGIAIAVQEDLSGRRLGRLEGGGGERSGIAVGGQAGARVVGVHDGGLGGVEVAMSRDQGGEANMVVVVEVVERKS